MKIHTAVVQGLSDPLYAMMTNGMQESVEKTASLSDTEPAVFAMFCEYAYSGICRYFAKEAKKRSLTSEEDKYVKDLEFCNYCGGKAQYSLRPNGLAMLGRCHANACEQQTTEDRRYCARCKSSRNRGWETKLCTHCRERWSDIPSIVTEFTEKGWQRNHPSVVAGVSGLGKDYLGDGKRDLELQEWLEEIRICSKPDLVVSRHGQLHIFGLKYLIEPLQKVCLHKLQRDLLQFEVSDETIEEIVKLVRLSFENTSTPGDDSQDVDIGLELRNMILTYMVWKAKALMGFDEFKALLAEGGDLTTEFMVLVVGRLDD